MGQFRTTGTTHAGLVGGTALATHPAVALVVVQVLAVAAAAGLVVVAGLAAHPQLSSSFCRSLHTPRSGLTHRAVGDAAPPMHVWLLPQVVPQPPQLPPSFCRFLQPPPQQSGSGHRPSRRRHSSSRRSGDPGRYPPQFVWPIGQFTLHEPPAHIWLPLQALPHIPQLAGSVSRLLHTPHAAGLVGAAGLCRTSRSWIRAFCRF
jgi:hypothetical protein